MAWRRGFAVALAVLALDRVSKLWLIDMVREAGGFIEVTGFFNLVMVWNRGISFGLLPSEGAGRWLLIAVTSAIVLALVVWMVRAKERWLVLALGLIIGGAAGNIIDRAWYGAVADFFDVHGFGYHWPAFNVADSAIVVGVAFLMLDALFGRRSRGDDNEIGAAESGRRRG
ncbi:MAG: signal peptidase II [Alphaproteobacteria bacterium]